jgi:long-subunit acyl-CoA synthetase (AMP-forming)
MAGYYKDPDATNRAMGDGWFKTATPRSFTKTDMPRSAIDSRT